MEAARITNAQEMELAFGIRKKVFVEEQGVAEEVELDEHDKYADHVLVYSMETPVATGRVRNVEGVAKLERICVLQTHRKYGIGKAVVEALESIARERGFAKAKLNSQTHAESFYQKLGYTAVSDIFMEEGIPHLTMIKHLN